MKIFNKLAPYILTLSLAMAPKLKAERISGYIDHVNTNESLEGLTVNVEGLDSTTTDENGFYEIGPNAVIMEPNYKFPIIQITNKNILYNSLGQRITNLTKNDLESKTLPFSIPAGKYFIQEESGLTIPFVKLGHSRTLPIKNIEEILPKENKEIRNKSGNKSKISSIRELIVTGEGYHSFNRTIDIGDNTEYDFFMIPFDPKEEEEWAYENTLECFKDLCVMPYSGKPAGPRPGDLPFEIISPRMIQRDMGTRGTNFLEALEYALEENEDGGELDWFDNEIIYRDDQEQGVEGIEKGVLLTFTNRPHGGGVAYLHRRGEYDDETPYLFEVEIDSNSAQITAEVIFLRELARIIGLADDAPYRSPYVMAHEWGGAYIVDGEPYYHPQEEKTIKLHYNINKRFETKEDRPNIKDWYLIRENQ